MGAHCKPERACLTDENGTPWASPVITINLILHSLIILQPPANLPEFPSRSGSSSVCPGGGQALAPWEQRDNWPWAPATQAGLKVKPGAVFVAKCKTSPQSWAHRLCICKHASVHMDNDFQSKILLLSGHAFWKTNSAFLVTSLRFWSHLGCVWAGRQKGRWLQALSEVLQQREIHWWDTKEGELGWEYGKSRAKFSCRTAKGHKYEEHKPCAGFDMFEAAWLGSLHWMQHWCTMWAPFPNFWAALLKIGLRCTKCTKTLNEKEKP